MRNRPSAAQALALAALTAVAAGLQAAPAHAQTRLGELVLEPCTLTADGAPPVEARCTTHAVPEDRDAPDGRRIDLAVAVVGGDGAPGADPVFFLAGGPGQSARESYPQIAPVFREVLRTRDVVLVDQRGTGDSNPLACQDDADALPGAEAESPAAARQAALDCLRALEDRADPRHYTTTDAVHDLEAVRAALGAETLNLVGVSYGTRVAQQYLRAFPERVRTLVLDGVVPNTLALGSEHARSLEDALALHFAQCEAVDACRDRLGSPQAHLDMLRARLLDGGTPVAFRDARTAAPREETLALAHLQTVVRMYAYQPALAAMLPLVLSEAASGHYAPLAAQAQLLIDQLGASISHGMQLSVVCSEDVDRLPEAGGDANTLLGDLMQGFLAAQCAVWPRGRTPEDFHLPARGDVPALLLSGQFDPVTPPRYGDSVLEGLPNGRHLVLAGQGHNVLPVGCTPRLLARFIDTADAEALDADCLDGLRPAPPFTGYHGWEP